VCSGLELEMKFRKAKIRVRVFRILHGPTFKADILRLSIDCFYVARIKGCSNRVGMT
jgi:hypothetical protein